MKSGLARLRYLVESIDELRDRHSRRRKLLLVLLYWKIFDGIDIPRDVMQEILHRATNPETIFRHLRTAQHTQSDADTKE